MAVLGGKSKPSMKNLKPFIKVGGMHNSSNSIFPPFPSQDSHIVRLVCDEVKQEEELVKELERGAGDGEQQFFLADPGWSKIYSIARIKKLYFLP